MEKILNIIRLILVIITGIFFSLYIFGPYTYYKKFKGVKDVKRPLRISKRKKKNE